ncbi:MAG: pyridoxal-phosphate dependent enzyme, partial [Candidatus Bathyarchaeia archaeon]
MSLLRCTECKHVIEVRHPMHKCPECGGLLEYELDYERLKGVNFTGEFTFWRYRTLLPEVENLASMHEGGTPLHKAKRLAKRVGLEQLYLKDETRNPTNSFRDRCAALLVSNALDLNYSVLVCATNGNLGASLSAYCGKYGIICHVVIPKVVDMGKLAQMLIYDAVIEEYGETVDKSMERAERLAEETGWYQASSELNPLTIEAQKTIAFEVTEQLGVSDWFIVSMGSGGTIYSVWKGFRELYELGKIERVPRMIGVQAEGCSPIIDAYLKIKRKNPARPFTHAVGILVKKPMQQALALKAIELSEGTVSSASDQEILSAEQEVAKLEGV